MTRKEMKALVKAMEQDEFKDILTEYVQEISDPKNKAEYEEYLRQLERQNELPPNTKLVKPVAGFCIKTTSKKLMSKTDMKYFDQKAFVNVCTHDVVPRPEKIRADKDGKSGFTFNLPYRVSKGRHDQDRHGVLCATYDGMPTQSLKTMQLFSTLRSCRW